MADPLHQFAIQKLIPLEIAGHDVSFTNSSLFMVLATLSVVIFLGFVVMHAKVVPGRIQSVGEILYEFVTNMIDETIGPKGIQYFPFIFTLFMFILVGNLLGMFPYAFTFTSHIVVTFGLAMVVFIFVTCVGFAKHGLHFFSLFAPKGIPLIIAPLLIPIEMISYLVRPISLSVRLFASMLGGHVALKIFAGFIVSMGAFGFIPYIASVGLIGFEIFVCLLQAYIFTILTCVYFNDAVNLH